MTLLHVIAYGTPGVALLHYLASCIEGEAARRDALFAAVMGTALVEMVVLPVLAMIVIFGT